MVKILLERYGQNTHYQIPTIILIRPILCTTMEPQRGSLHLVISNGNTIPELACFSVVVFSKCSIHVLATFDIREVFLVFIRYTSMWWHVIGLRFIWSWEGINSGEFQVASSILNIASLLPVSSAQRSV